MPLSRNAPFFIVGSGRSGSTLLRMMISSHSRITIPPETWFIIPLVENLSLHSRLTRDEVQTALHIITSHYRWPDMGLAADSFCQGAFALESPLLRDIINLVYQHHQSSACKPRWGNKTPGYFRILPQLLRLYPDSRFLHLVRDGRDVAKSMQATGWHGPWLHDCAKEWTEAIDVLAAQ